MRVFGVPSLTVHATATALPKGKTKQPYNIAIILDGTPSMASTDSNCEGNSEEQCALNAIESLLTHISPCAGSVSCTADSDNAIDRISLFSFPNVSTTDVTKDKDCSGTPSWMNYTFPKIPTSDGTPTGNALTTGYKPISYDSGATYATYQITAPSGTSGKDPDANGFSSDYSPGSGGYVLNPNSVLVKVMGNTTTGTSPTQTKGCLKEPGYPPVEGSSQGETYFAGAIYAAQAALQAEKVQSDTHVHNLLGNSINSANVIIFISDGQANAYYSSAVSRFPPLGSTATTASSLGVGGYSISGTAPTSTWTSTGKNMKNGSVAGTWGTYPDANNDCQQAMMAAQYAVNQHTIVFGVAYGAETDGCLTTGPSGHPGVDSTLAGSITATGTFNVALTAPSVIVPCVTIENIADSWAHFFADTSSNNCKSTLQNPLASLAVIFNEITGDLGPTPKLVPNTLN
jgi:hypothetical protein